MNNINYYKNNCIYNTKDNNINYYKNNNMELVMVASRFNMTLGAAASMPNLELDSIASRLDMGLDVDVSRPNL